MFQTDLSVSGALDISVAFQAPKTLLVTVHGATNLAPRDVNGSADPFVKIAIPGCDKVCQTQVKLLKVAYTEFLICFENF